MASTNSPSVIWVASETVGRNGSGGTTTNLPSDVINVHTSDGSAAPTYTPTGSPFHLTAASGFFAWNGSNWIGPI